MIFRESRRKPPLSIYCWAASIGLLFSACDSSEARTDEEDYTQDSSTKESKSLATASDKKDAATEMSKDGETKTSKNASSNGSAGASSNSSGASQCGDNTCKSPAKCEDKRCVCPDGYEDVKGDGSECKDIDECKTRKADCAQGAACKNEPGGYKCMCSAPAYVADGDNCKCADGYTRDKEGYCVGDDGKSCSDSLDCKNKACEGGICCAQQCADPGECHETEGAKCSDDGKSCIYPVSKDGVSCDDGMACTKDGTCKEGKCQESKEATSCDDKNPCTDDSCTEPNGCRNMPNAATTCDDGSPCTSDDKCVVGQCKGTEKDCSGAADVCNTGACDAKSGECTKKPRTASIVCDDMNSCTTGDMCKDGACSGGGNACGASATACMPGPTPAENMCTCAADFVTFQGRCVPMNDECQSSNPCSPNAICTDASSKAGDVTCACKPGFTGDGKECRATDPCATNPCGMGGTCTNDNKGGYTCTCAAGQRQVGGKCGCDLTGTFGMRGRQIQAWANVDRFVEDGEVVLYSYSLLHQTLDADGNLKLEIVDCGASSADLCSVPFPPFLGAEAYGQYVPNSVFGSPSMPRTNVSLKLADTQPGSAFKSDQFAIITGLKLDDPMGPWPKDRYAIAGAPDSTSATNGATWLDADGDGVLGLTTYAIPPGGEKIDGVPPDPPQDYGANSVECPRSNTGARSPYAYPPALPDGSVSTQRIKRVFTGQRAILAFDGKIDSCDLVSGSVTGPDNGTPRAEARVFGCVRVNGNGESACAAGAIDFLDQQPQTQTVREPTFKLKRLSAEASCSAVLAASYD